MDLLFIITPIGVGGFLIVFIYGAYFLVLPPFYQLRTIEYGRSVTLDLVSQVEDEIWILPGPRYTSYPHYCLTEDLTFKLNFSLLSHSECPVHIRVCAGSELLSKTGTNLSERVDQTVPLNFPRGPGGWLSRTELPRDGYVLYLTVRNLGQEDATVSVTYSVIGFYRLGHLLNLIIVFIGILIIGFTLLITFIHSITFLTRKIREYRFARANNDHAQDEAQRQTLNIIERKINKIDYMQYVEVNGSQTRQIFSF